MRKFISRLAVILFVPMALVPPGYMPVSPASGNGYLMLCPSSGNQFSSSNQHIQRQDSLSHNSSDQHSHHAERTHSHSDSDNATVDETYDTHRSISNICSYATITSDHGLVKLSPLKLIAQATRSLSYVSGKSLLFIPPRLEKQHTRAPPSSFFLS